MKLLTGLQYAALFMISLVLSLPFYSSFAYADTTGTIQDITVQGKMGVRDSIAGSDDYINSTVRARLLFDNEPVVVSGNNIRFEMDGSEGRFGQCIEQENGYYYCTYMSSRRDRTGGLKPYTIKLYDHSFVKKQDVTGSLVIDAVAPFIREFGLAGREFIPASQFDIAYDISDRACSSCATDICAGTARLDIYLDNVLKKTVYINNSETCDAVGSFSMTPESLGVDEGPLDLCLKAYDKVGLSSTSCLKIGADFTYPQAIEGSFRFTDEFGTDITHASRSEMLAQVTMDFLDEQGMGSVSGDFSGFNPDLEDEYKSVKGECEKGDDNINHCTWRFMLKDVSGNIGMRIEAGDKAGNNLTISKSFNLAVDSSPPTIEKIMNGAKSEDYVAIKNNTIIARINDDGSGMDGRRIMMNLQDFNPAWQSVRADNCTGGGNTWDCYWYNIDIPSGNQKSLYRVWIVSMEDDSGNQMSDGSQASKSFRYDDKVPRFLNMTLTPKGAGRDVLLADGSEVAEISAYIQETGSGISPENAFADISQFSSAYNGSSAIAAQSCDPSQDDPSIYHCIWEYSGEFEAGRTVNVYATVYDDAGNIRKSKDDKVFGKAFIAGVTERVVDYWNERTGVSGLYPVNRNFIWMSSGGIYQKVQLSLKSKGGNVPYVHGFDIDSCLGRIKQTGSKQAMTNESDALGYESFAIRNQYYLPAAPRSSKVIIINVPNFEKSLLEDARSIEVECKGSILQAASAKGNVFIPYEEVNASFEIKLSDTVFEDPGQATIDKITQKEQDIKQLENWINWLTAITKFLEPLCKLLNTVRLIITTFCSIVASISIFFNNPMNSTCISVTDTVTHLWDGRTELQNSENLPGSKLLWYSNKNAYMSIGFACDLVLCESCADWMSNPLSQGLSSTGLGRLMPDKKTVQTDDKGNAKLVSVMQKDKESNEIKDEKGNPITEKEKLTLGLSPFKSLVVSVLCFPPCLVGIKSKLEVYKEILINYNVCINVATFKGEDTHQCEEFLDSQICQQVLGEFWYLVTGIIKTILMSYAMYVFEEVLLQKSVCELKLRNVNAAYNVNCTIHSIYHITDILLKFFELQSQLEELSNQEIFKMGNTQRADNAKAAAS